MKQAVRPQAPIVRPVVPVAPPAVPFMPRPVAQMSTTGEAADTRFRPGLVLAQARPGWPAPTSTAVIDVTATDPTRLAVPGFNAGTIVSENIFGGPVTVGDPSITTLTIDPYTDKVVRARPEGLSPDEGWTDIFGREHGAEVPEAARSSRRSRAGAFGVRTALRGFGAMAGRTASVRGIGVFPGLSPIEVVLWVAAGKNFWGSIPAGGVAVNPSTSPAAKQASGEYVNAWTDWKKSLGLVPGSAQWNDQNAPYGPDDYAKAVMAGKALAPVGWKLSMANLQGSAPPPPPPPQTERGPSPGTGDKTDGVGMSTGAKIGIAAAAVAVVGGALFVMKRKKAQ